MIDFYQDGEKTTTITFPGEVPVDTTASLEFEIDNTNNFPVELEVIENPDDDFTLENVPERLAPGKRYTITVEFTPTQGRPPFDIEQLFKVIW